VPDSRNFVFINYSLTKNINTEIAKKERKRRNVSDDDARGEIQHKDTKKKKKNGRRRKNLNLK